MDRQTASSLILFDWRTLPSWSCHAPKLKSVKGCQCGFSAVTSVVALFSLTSTCCTRFTAATSSKSTCRQHRDPEGKSGLGWPETPQGDSDSIPISTATARKRSPTSGSSHSQPGAHTRGQCCPSDRRTVSNRHSVQGHSNLSTHAKDIVVPPQQNFSKLPGFSEYTSFSYNNNVCKLGEKNLV